jgi:hypothetical protein
MFELTTCALQPQAEPEPIFLGTARSLPSAIRRAERLSEQLRMPVFVAGCGSNETAVWVNLPTP